MTDSWLCLRGFVMLIRKKREIIFNDIEYMFVL